MPKTKFVKDIQEGEQVKDLFLVANKALLSSNSGKPYINLSLRDRTGQMECRVWDRAEEIAKRFDRDDIVEATGSAILYQGRIQLKVHDVRRVEGGGPLRCPPRAPEGDRLPLERAPGAGEGMQGSGPLPPAQAGLPGPPGNGDGAAVPAGPGGGKHAPRLQRRGGRAPRGGSPADKTMLLKHMILSHHGELEYGSPKRPKTLEAILLHFVENMDSKANAFLEAVGGLREGGSWTDYQRVFERYLFAGRREKK